MQLALETSTNICSVVLKDASGILHEKRTESKGSHSEQLFLFIDELKEEHHFDIWDLESIIVSEGPGSYTGLRISASAVKGLLFGQKAELYSASTLASFAVSAATHFPEPATVHSIIDARRVHLYHQKFTVNAENIIAESEVEVIPIEQFEKLVKPGEGVIGTGHRRIDAGVLSEVKVLNTKYISARSLFSLLKLDRKDQLIQKVAPQQYEPRYYTSGQAYKKGD